MVLHHYSITFFYNVYHYFFFFLTFSSFVYDIGFFRKYLVIFTKPLYNFYNFEKDSIVFQPRSRYNERKITKEYLIWNIVFWEKPA